ncbi:MAG: SDR family oxidoreductase, partial [Firmicutes bacterium]|nr:SDR family oxidoreductase [Bacillota bacterium]
LEYGPFGVTVNMIAPGLVDTAASAEIAQGFREQLREMTPLQRIASPEDVARAVLLYVLPESGFITGSFVPVNGGISMD